MKLFLISLLSIPLLAQTKVQVNADCSIAFNFSASGSTPVIAGNPNTGDNRQVGCESWTLQYQSTGFSGVSLRIQSAPGPLTAGTFVTYAGTIDTGINPNTSLMGATTTAHNGTATIPWIRVNAVLTGTGTLNGVLYGLKSGASAGGGGGSSGCPNPCPVIGTAAAGAPPSGAPVQVAGSDGTDIRTVSTDATGKVNVVTTPASGSSQNVVVLGNGTFNTNQQAVTASATALATNSAKSVCVTAFTTNTTIVYIGPSGVTTSTGFPLAPGQGTCQPLSNSNLIFVVGTVGASVGWGITN